ncbi:hypothetical protein KKH38_02925 [Patescibacteria group bacterium]|nr:hypothetical protein [Patescibacteria group bacterium]MCG2698175.1 hypothetical protein [Candidatus Parcubacteria bacterium]
MTLTPEQFNKLAAKEDLKKLASKDELTAVKDEILTVLDGIAKTFEDHKIEHVANIGAHDRFEEKFTKNDDRIKVIEKKFEASHVAA